MNQTHLEYFVRVYQYRNVSKAAADLHIARQSLSKVINDLEAEVGSELFTRTHDGLIPTSAGDELFLHAENILREYEQIQKINYLGSLHGREVIVYTFDCVTDFLSEDFFIAFNRKYPDIIINMQETNEDDAKNRVLLQKCNLAIVTDAVDLSNVKKEFMFRMEYTCIINEANPLSRKEVICAEDFAGQKIIGKSSELGYYLRDTNLRMGEGVHYDFYVEVNNTALRERMVQKNAGIALAWDYTALTQREIPHCVVRPIYHPNWGCSVFMIENASHPSTAQSQIVKEAVFSWIRDRTV